MLMMGIIMVLGRNIKRMNFSEGIKAIARMRR
jgi:hypothetical protein